MKPEAMTMIIAISKYRDPLLRSWYIRIVCSAEKRAAFEQIQMVL
jgi:hypothetical protein